VTIPPPPPPTYGGHDPGYPALPRSLSSASGEHPGGEPVRVGALPFLSVVLAFCLPVVGLVLGIIALVQTREPGRGSKGVAWVGRAVSFVSTIVLIVLTVQFFG